MESSKIFKSTMNINQVFNVFSRRHKGSNAVNNTLNTTFRNRVLMLCSEVFSNPDPGHAPGDYREQFWSDIYAKLSFLLGKYRLSDKHGNSPGEDAILFLSKCEDENFLDFIEYIFQVECYWRVCSDKNKFIEEINQLFLVDDLPYAVTPFVHEKRIEYSFGRDREVSALVNYPKVIRRDDEIIYSSAIQPTIVLLIEKNFTSANNEFIEALQDYRKGNYGDCLTKCGSAFESTMKIICNRNRWSYNQSDTASRLLQIIIEKSGIDPFFKEPLILIATLRNRLSTAHGSGTEKRTVSKHKAKYAINVTASAMLLLVEECL